MHLQFFGLFCSRSSDNDAPHCIPCSFWCASLASTYRNQWRDRFAFIPFRSFSLLFSSHYMNECFIFERRKKNAGRDVWKMTHFLFIVLGTYHGSFSYLPIIQLWRIFNSGFVVLDAAATCSSSRLSPIPFFVVFVGFSFIFFFVPTTSINTTILWLCSVYCCIVWLRFIF